MHNMQDTLQIIVSGMSNPGNNNEKRTPLIPSSPRAPYRDYGFEMPISSATSDNIFSYSGDRFGKSSNDQTHADLDDLGLLSDTLQRLDAEIESDIRSGIAKPTTGVTNLDLLSGAMKRVASLESALRLSNQRAVDAEKELAALQLITADQIRIPRCGF